MTTDRLGVLRLIGCLILLANVLGCASEPEPVPVSGKITVGKKPLTEARVQFVPDRQKGNTAGREARGKVDANGVYVLSTGDKPGAIPGWYKVAVFAFEEVPDGAAPKPITWLAPMHYADPERSGLVAEVTATPSPGQYDFDLKP